MNGEHTWKKITTALEGTPTEVATVPSNNKELLWFNAYIENGKLYVGNSESHSPSTNISQRRKITKNDFMTVYEYYHRWANGKRYLRQKVREISRNTAYIFALISHFE